MNRAMQSAIVKAFRRAALPLGWYYAITIGLPLANGAAQAGAAFTGHALVVLVVPLILIAFVGAARELVVRIRITSAFGRRCIPTGCVARRSNITYMLTPRALPSGRIAALGARGNSDPDH
jgi:hypothetical protein